MDMPATAVILAAGSGTRMKSSLPKPLHRIAGWPMLCHLLESCAAVFDRTVVVVGPEMAAVAELAAPHPVVVQQDRSGTAHAALQAAELFGGGEVAVLYADNPLITPATLRRLLARRAAGDVGLALLAMRPADPARYGRVFSRDGLVDRIVEFADATEAERAQRLCNAGVLSADAARMRAWLERVGNANEKREYYLTDVVALARADGALVAAVEAPADELCGINSRAELAAAEATVQGRLRAAALEAGVTMTAPDTVFLCVDTRLAPDVTIGPNVVFGPGVTVDGAAEIRAFSHLEGCRVGAGAIVGPFARLRPGTVAARMSAISSS
jgi:bifunctional UDP-N-acetylglucosamine pyrophosphorylase/glucosamine-1-phosphate N-acetyltransferase